MCIWDIHHVASVVLWGRSKVPDIHSMLGKFVPVPLPLKNKDFFSGVDRGVQLKSNSPFRKVLVNRWWFNHSGRRRLRVSTACWIRQHHNCNRNLGSQLDNPSIKWCLDVWISRSRMRARYRPGGTSWCCAPVERM